MVENSKETYSASIRHTGCVEWVLTRGLNPKLEKNFKYDTYTATRGHDQRIIGQPFNSFQGLISARSQNFDADEQERLTRSSKVLLGGRCFFCPRGHAFAGKFCPRAGLLTTSKNFPGGLPGGEMFTLGID